VKNQSQVS